MKARPAAPALPSFVIVTGAITAGILLFARLGNLAAGPLAQINTFWLPLGFAAAAVLVLGFRLSSLGVILGMLGAGVWLAVDAGTSPVAAAGLGLLSAGQALWVARVLSERVSFLRQPDPGERRPLWVRPWRNWGAWLAFLQWSALACAPLAAAGAAARVLAGQAGQGWLLEALYWWLGNWLAVFAVTPLLAGLGHWLQSSPAMREHVLLAVDVGIAFSALAFYMTWTLETQRITTEFVNDAEAAALSMQQTRNLLMHDVELVSTLFAASAQVTREDFATLTRPHFLGASVAPGLQALTWNVIVAGAERPAFEAAERAAGLTDFQITERGAAGNLVRAGERARYVVSLYQAPSAPNRLTIGFDLASDPARRAALEQAEQTGRPAVTAALKLLSTGQTGFALIWPVYELRTPETVSARPASLRGFAIGLYQLAEMVQGSLLADELGGLDIYLFDLDAAAGAQLLFARSAPERVAPLDAPAGLGPDQVQTGLYYAAPLPMAGRNWLLVIRPAPSFSAARRTWVPWAVLLIGLAVTCWAAIYFAQRLEAEEALRLSEANLNRAQAVAHAGSWYLDIPRGRLIWSAETYRLFGLPPDTPVDQAFYFTRIHPDDREAVSQVWETVLAGGPCDVEHRICLDDGQVRWVREQAELRYRPDGAPLAAIGSIQDITERKQAELRLRAREQQWRTILHTTQDGFWIADIHGAFVEVNQAYCAMSGYTREEFLGLRISHVEVNEAPESVATHIAAIRQRGIDLFETRHRRKDGSVFDVEVSAAYLEQSGGQVACFCRDITARKRAAEEVRQLNSELEARVAARTTELSRTNAELTRALRSKDEFLSTMSHELRTPLTGILGFAEVLGEQIRGPLNERQLEAVGHIETSGRHLLALINDILDLSKMDASRLELHRELTSVEEVCRMALLLVKAPAAKKRVELQYQPAPEGTQVLADARRLKQMLVNLLGNAVKFTPAGGQVFLSATVDAERGQLRLAVRDTGIGIAAEDLGRLFQSFTQLDSGLARQHEGTGLGLALVRRLAELHGGSVSVESGGLGEGSCFVVVLPWGEGDRVTG